MKQIKNITQLCLLILVGFSISSCQEEDQVFGEIITPVNLTINFEIVGQDSANPNGDGSGLVNFTATADNAISYRFNFGDNTGDILAPGGANTHRFNQAGLNTYVVTLIASGKGGISSSISQTVEVFSDFNPIEIKNLITGGPSSSKTWYWDAALPAHLGVGPFETADPSYYAAAPFEKESVGCLYEDTMIFSQDDNENISFELINLGNTYFNRFEVEDELGLANPGEDTCYEYDTSGAEVVNFAPSTSGIDASLSTQTSFSIQNRRFMSYFVGSNDFEILSISETQMHVRVIQTEPSGNLLAWYQKFTTDPPISGGLCSGLTGDDGSGNNDVLVWADEFDTDGAPCSDNWAYDMGAGGWGNEELQYYTDRPENVLVENGLLKITAKAENFNGSPYTSARILSKNKFEFNYGRVEVRAKFAEGGGTWPAIWMLGANFDTVGWPDCGEIDIAEHVGNNQNTVFATLHYPGNSGGNGVTDTTLVPTASTEFHNYEVQWTATEINFSVDGQQFHTFANNGGLPFNQDFFLILNTAMGGNFGGQVDPNFVQSTFEIDYVRVYQ